jgi:hypothetical protein
MKNPSTWSSFSKASATKSQLPSAAQAERKLPRQACEMLILGVSADRADVFTLVRVVHVREARVVELQIRAAELPEAAHLVAVGEDEVGPERVQIGIDAWVDRGLAAPVVHHAWRRNRQLRDVLRDGALEKAERVPEDRLRDPQLAVDVQRRGRELDVALFVVKLDLDLAGLFRDSVELVDEVHMPRCTAELTISGGL